MSSRMGEQLGALPHRPATSCWSRTAGLVSFQAVYLSQHRTHIPERVFKSTDSKGWPGLFLRSWASGLHCFTQPASQAISDFPADTYKCSKGCERLEWQTAGLKLERPVEGRWPTGNGRLGSSDQLLLLIKDPLPTARPRGHIPHQTTETHRRPSRLGG